jgi:AraC-like DNA-binding protein
MAFGNVVASLMIEKSSIDYISLNKQFSLNTPNITEIASANWLDNFKNIYENTLTKKDISSIINQLIGTTQNTKKLIDPRINGIMEIINKNPDINYSQEYLASSVGLSSSRFRHLFRHQADISFRQYRLWRRVVTAMSILHDHDNLTYAALEAGFTDSSHFNRCFRNTFGVNPSLVFRNINRFEVET